jgi:hypothetical protein
VSGRWSRIASYLEPGVPLLRWTIFSLAVSFGFVEIFGRTFNRQLSLVWHVLLGFILALAVLVPLIFVILTLIRAFKPRGRFKHLLIVIFSYFALLLAFSGAHYSMSAFGDRVDAEAKYRYYSDSANYLDPNGEIVARIDSRAYSGIQRRLWSGVDWPDYRNNQLRDEDRTPVPLEDMIEATKRPLDEVSNFQARGRFGVFGTLVYYSVVTMTLLGYGDIVPTAWYSKAVVSLQILSGFALFYIALMMVVSNWWAEPETASAADGEAQNGQE